MLNKKRNWREELGLTALDYPIPTHANSFWYSLGGITLFCFVVTFVTGVILTQFYNPSPTVAHASVRYISATPGLKLIRALHHWSANLGFALLIAHMLRVVFTGGYRPPRTITYLFGVALLFVAFQLFFTGTVLKWDQEGYEAMAQCWLEYTAYTLVFFRCCFCCSLHCTHFTSNTLALPQNLIRKRRSTRPA
jgi:quinol-cytochrome oxidoreductase complex cytochrome b subunit